MYKIDSVHYHKNHFLDDFLNYLRDELVGKNSYNLDEEIKSGRKNFGLTNKDTTYLLVCRCELMNIYCRSNLVSRLVMTEYSLSLMTTRRPPGRCSQW